MRARRRTARAVLLMAVLLLFYGCGKIRATESSTGGLYIWYLNEEGNGLVHWDYEGDGGTESDETPPSAEALIADLLTAMRIAPDKSGYMPLLDDDVLVSGYRLENGILTLDFSGNYASMTAAREVLARGGIVRMFVQLPGVSGVRFTIEGRDAESPSGVKPGVMNADTFVEDAGKQVNAIAHVAINLYFTGESGRTLRREARSIYYTSSKPLEWAIVERIIAGPKVSGNYATVPANTQIISVTTENGTCYVNLNQTFQTNALSIDAQIPIYSIVNSLVDDCSHISQVKISVEGESNLIFRQSMDLSHPFEADYTLVEASITGAD